MKKFLFYIIILTSHRLFSMEMAQIHVGENRGELHGDFALEFIDVLQSNSDAFVRYCIGLRKRLAKKEFTFWPLAYSYSKKTVTEKDFCGPCRLFQTEDKIWYGDPAHVSLSWPNELILFGKSFSWLEKFTVGKIQQFGFLFLKLTELMRLSDFARTLRECVIYQHPQSAYCIVAADFSQEDANTFHEMEKIWEDAKFRFLISLIEI